jgi:hypothetical protein
MLLTTKNLQIETNMMQQDNTVRMKCSPNKVVVICDDHIIDIKKPISQGPN